MLLCCSNSSEGSRHTPLDPTVGDTCDAGLVLNSEVLDLILLLGSLGDENNKVEYKFLYSKLLRGSNTGLMATNLSGGVEKDECVLGNLDSCGTSNTRGGVRHNSLGPQIGDSRDVGSLYRSKTLELVLPQILGEDEDAEVSSELGGLCSWKESGDLAAVIPPSKPFIVQTQYGAKSVGISIILH